MMRFVFQSLLVLILALSLSSCTSVVHQMQPKVQNLLVTRNIDGALSAFDKGPASYGKDNELLFWLDYGFVQHLAGKYRESIKSFEKAKALYDALYGKSAAEVAGAVLVNDYWQKYRGEDYEYILLNVFQSLNYAVLGEKDEAVADIRRIDFQLKLINARYTKEQKNVYKDDAFARALGGIMYEALGREGLNDAYISNALAARLYKEDYQENYGVSTPRFLKSNLLTTAQFMGWSELSQHKKDFPDIELNPASEKQRKAVVYLVQYTGFVPLKTEETVIVPLDATHITRLSIAKLVPRPFQSKSSTLCASSQAGVEINVPTDVAEDIGAIAQKVMENRKAWEVSKALLRPAAKYAIEKTTEEQLRQHDHDILASVFNLVADVYNVVSEKADLREWEMLPNEIRVGQMILEPGTYSFKVKDYDAAGALLEEGDLGTVELVAGEQKIFLSRSYR